MAQIDSKQIARLETLLVGLQRLVAELKSPSVSVPAKVRLRIAQFARESRCLYCSEPIGTSKTTRGCHQVCYGKLKRRMDRGPLTLQEAVNRGWINPVAEPPGRKTSRPDPMRQNSAQASAAAGEALGEAKLKIIRDRIRDSSEENAKKT
jgi:hypothetical protein